MKRLLSTVCLLAALLAVFGIIEGCGSVSRQASDRLRELESQEKTEPETQPETQPQTRPVFTDRQAIESYLTRLKSGNPGVERLEITRLDFATDNQGNRWALAFTDTYMKADPRQGLFEAYVFEKRGGAWQKVGGGSGGFSYGVPPEVQQEWGITGD